MKQRVHVTTEIKKKGDRSISDREKGRCQSSTYKAGHSEQLYGSVRAAKAAGDDGRRRETGKVYVCMYETVWKVKLGARNCRNKRPCIGQVIK